MDCLACGIMGDNDFHSNSPWRQFFAQDMQVKKKAERKGTRKARKQLGKVQKDLAACKEIASTSDPEEIQEQSKLGDSEPEFSEKVGDICVSEMKDEGEQKKTVGRKMKVGKSLKNFYPKLKRYIKARRPLDASMRIGDKNRMEILEKYGQLVRPFLMELSEYVPSRTQARTNKARDEEKQKKWEKKKAIQLLKEYDKICKKS